jgi:hypothetical protein
MTSSSRALLLCCTILLCASRAACATPNAPLAATPAAGADDDGLAILPDSGGVNASYAQLALEAPSDSGGGGGGGDEGAIEINSSIMVLGRFDWLLYDDGSGRTTSRCIQMVGAQRPSPAGRKARRWPGLVAPLTGAAPHAGAPGHAVPGQQDQLRADALLGARGGGSAAARALRRCVRVHLPAPLSCRLMGQLDTRMVSCAAACSWTAPGTASWSPTAS